MNPVGSERGHIAATENEAAKGISPGRAVRKRRSPWPMRIVLLVIVIVAGLVLARGASKKPISVDTSAVEMGTVRDEVSSSTAGEVMAEKEATVRAELVGRVLDVKHRRGERVKAGEVVVALDSADLDARLQQSRAMLLGRRAQVTQAEAHAEAARRTADTEKRLVERGAQASRVAEDAAAQAREAEAMLRSARAELDNSEASLLVAKVARAHGSLMAPFDGLLADVLVDPGDELQPGAIVFELIDDSRLHVEATIDEADISRVKVGQPASLRLDALPGRPIAGVVSKLDPTVRKDEKGARALRIEVEVSDLPKAVSAGVRPGMSANVDVTVAEKKNVLSLPTNVIIGRGTKRSVYLIENGVVHDRPIQVGVASWERSEITDGLREGDKVVANLNTKGLADGVPVRTVQENGK